MTRILIVNPPHWAVGSRLAGEHLPPLGLLSIAGPLIDAGTNFGNSFLQQNGQKKK
jgi:anaerobic magnesium-protoporphyrin IX monomethyl ester cyclase